MAYREPGSPEWIANLQSMIEAEASQPMRWWYFSFAKPEQWLGGCYVEERGGTLALAKLNELGVNPGGEVYAFELPAGAIEEVPLADRNRLLSKVEIGPMVRITGEDA